MGDRNTHIFNREKDKWTYDLYERRMNIIKEETLKNKIEL